MIIDKCKQGQKPKCALERLRSLRLNSGNEREWTWSEYAEMVKFSKRPVHASLLRLERAELSQLAVNCFVDVMRYMGDYPLAKDQRQIDCVYFVLQTLHHHRELVDEVCPSASVGYMG